MSFDEDQFEIHNQQNHHPFFCTICKLSIFGNIKFKQHIESKDHRKRSHPFWCNVCEEGYKEHQHHILGVGHRERIKPFYCSKCIKGFVEYDLYSQHIHSNEHKKKLFRFWCDMCAQGFHENQDFDLHYEKLHSPTVCQICDLICNGQQGYELHLRSIKHKQRISPFWCSICNIGFQESMVYLLHNNQYHQIIPCLICNISCQGDINYKDHLDSYSHKKRVSPFWCDTCNVAFQESQEKCIHDQEKHHPHICITCGITSMGSIEHGQHINTRNHKIKESPFFCNVCNVGFNDWEKHVNSSGHRRNSYRYWCNICRIGFNEQQDYQKHDYDIHTPSFCEICNVLSYGNIQNQQHISSLSHRKRFFWCPRCGMNFYESWKYSNHIQEKHN